MDPPGSLPFQTRCQWKKDVQGDLCETEIPPQRDISIGHQIKCHLSESKLSKMTPVIKLAANDLRLILLVFKFVNIISAAEKKVRGIKMAGSVNKVIILGIWV